jgi:hypothetical protein
MRQYKYYLDRSLVVNSSILDPDFEQVLESLQWSATAAVVGSKRRKPPTLHTELRTMSRYFQGEETSRYLNN